MIRRAALQRLCPQGKQRRPRIPAAPLAQRARQRRPTPRRRQAPARGPAAVCFLPRPIRTETQRPSPLLVGLGRVNTEPRLWLAAPPPSQACRRQHPPPPHPKRNAAHPPPARGAGVLRIRANGAGWRHCRLSVEPVVGVGVGVGEAVVDGVLESVGIPRNGEGEVARAIPESEIADGNQAVRQRDGGQGFAVGEG